LPLRDLLGNWTSGVWGFRKPARPRSYSARTFGTEGDRTVLRFPENLDRFLLMLGICH